jgi:hypothetical protein
LATPLFDRTTESDGRLAATDGVSVGRQVLRRALNDRIRGRRTCSTQVVLYCECGRASCRDGHQDGLLVEVEVYDRARRVPTHFLIKDCHAVAGERVVERGEGFLIVEKFGRAGLEAVQLDRAQHQLSVGSA